MTLPILKKLLAFLNVITLLSSNFSYLPYLIKPKPALAAVDCRAQTGHWSSDPPWNECTGPGLSKQVRVDENCNWVIVSENNPDPACGQTQPPPPADNPPPPASSSCNPNTSWCEGETRKYCNGVGLPESIAQRWMEGGQCKKCSSAGAANTNISECGGGQGQINLCGGRSSGDSWCEVNTRMQCTADLSGTLIANPNALPQQWRDSGNTDCKVCSNNAPTPVSDNTPGCPPRDTPQQPPPDKSVTCCANLPSQQQSSCVKVISSTPNCVTTSLANNICSVTNIDWSCWAAYIALHPDQNTISGCEVYVNNQRQIIPNGFEIPGKPGTFCSGGFYSCSDGTAINACSTVNIGKKCVAPERDNQGVLESKPECAPAVPPPPPQTVLPPMPQQCLDFNQQLNQPIARIENGQTVCYICDMLEEPPNPPVLAERKISCTEAAEKALKEQQEQQRVQNLITQNKTVCQSSVLYEIVVSETQYTPNKPLKICDYGCNSFGTNCKTPAEYQEEITAQRSGLYECRSNTLYKKIPTDQTAYIESVVENCTYSCHSSLPRCNTLEEYSASLQALKEQEAAKKILDDKITKGEAELICGSDTDPKNLYLKYYSTESGDQLEGYELYKTCSFGCYKIAKECIPSFEQAIKNYTSDVCSNPDYSNRPFSIETGTGRKCFTCEIDTNSPFLNTKIPQPAECAVVDAYQKAIIEDAKQKAEEALKAVAEEVAKQKAQSLANQNTAQSNCKYDNQIVQVYNTCYKCRISESIDEFLVPQKTVSVNPLPSCKEIETKDISLITGYRCDQNNLTYIENGKPIAQQPCKELEICNSQKGACEVKAEAQQNIDQYIGAGLGSLTLEDLQTLTGYLGKEVSRGISKNIGGVTVSFVYENGEIKATAGDKTFTVDDKEKLVQNATAQTLFSDNYFIQNLADQKNPNLSYNVLGQDIKIAEEMSVISRIRNEPGLLKDANTVIVNGATVTLKPKGDSVEIEINGKSAGSYDKAFINNEGLAFNLNKAVPVTDPKEQEKYCPQNLQKAGLSRSETGLKPSGSCQKIITETINKKDIAYAEYVHLKTLKDAQKEGQLGAVSLDFAVKQSKYALFTQDGGTTLLSQDEAGDGIPTALKEYLNNTMGLKLSLIDRNDKGKDELILGGFRESTYSKKECVPIEDKRWYRNNIITNMVIGPPGCGTKILIQGIGDIGGKGILAAADKVGSALGGVKDNIISAVTGQPKKASVGERYVDYISALNALRNTYVETPTGTKNLIEAAKEAKNLKIGMTISELSQIGSPQFKDEVSQTASSLRATGDLLINVGGMLIGGGGGSAAKTITGAVAAKLPFAARVASRGGAAIVKKELVDYTTAKGLTAIFKQTALAQTEKKAAAEALASEIAKIAKPLSIGLRGEVDDTAKFLGRNAASNPVFQNAAVNGTKQGADEIMVKIIASAAENEKPFLKSIADDVAKRAADKVSTQFVKETHAITLANSLTLGAYGGSIEGTRALLTAQVVNSETSEIFGIPNFAQTKTIEQSLVSASHYEILLAKAKENRRLFGQPPSDLVEDYNTIQRYLNDPKNITEDQKTAVKNTLAWLNKYKDWAKSTEIGQYALNMDNAVLQTAVQTAVMWSIMPKAMSKGGEVVSAAVRKIRGYTISPTLLADPANLVKSATDDSITAAAKMGIAERLTSEHVPSSSIKHPVEWAKGKIDTARKLVTQEQPRRRLEIVSDGAVIEYKSGKTITLRSGESAPIENIKKITFSDNTIVTSKTEVIKLISEGKVKYQINPSATETIAYTESFNKAVKAAGSADEVARIINEAGLEKPIIPDLAAPVPAPAARPLPLEALAKGGRAPPLPQRIGGFVNDLRTNPRQTLTNLKDSLPIIGKKPVQQLQTTQPSAPKVTLGERAQNIVKQVQEARTARQNQIEIQKKLDAEIKPLRDAYGKGFAEGKLEPKVIKDSAGKELYVELSVKDGQTVAPNVQAKITDINAKLRAFEEGIKEDWIARAEKITDPVKKQEELAKAQNFKIEFDPTKSARGEQFRIIVDALLSQDAGAIKKAGTLYESITGSGKSTVIIPLLSALKATSTGKPVFVILSNEGLVKTFLNDATVKAFKKMGVDVVAFADGTPPEAFNKAQVIVTTKDVIFQSLGGKGVINEALMSKMKGAIALADEAESTLSLAVDYIKAQKSQVPVGNVEKVIFKRVYDHFSPLRDRALKEESLFVRKNKKGGFSNEVDADFNYREVVRLSAKDNPEALAYLEQNVLNKSGKDLRTAISAFEKSNQTSPSLKIAQTNLRENIPAFNSILNTLSDIPDNNFGILDDIVVPKDNAQFTGRRYSNPFDALAYETIGRERLGKTANWDNITVSGEGLRTNYAEFLKNFSEVIGFTGTPGQLAPASKNIFGLELGVKDVGKNALRVFGDNPERPVSKILGIEKPNEIIADTSLKTGQRSYHVLGSGEHPSSSLAKKIEAKAFTAKKKVIRANLDPKVENGLVLKNTNGAIERVFKSQDELNTFLKESSDSFVVIVEKGSDRGADLFSRSTDKFTVIIDQNTDMTTALQAIGRDRGLNGGYSDLTIQVIGKGKELNKDSLKAILDANELIATQNQTLDGLVKVANNLPAYMLNDLRNAYLSSPVNRARLALGQKIDAPFDAFRQKWQQVSSYDMSIGTDDIAGTQVFLDSINKGQRFIAELRNDPLFRSSKEAMALLDKWTDNGKIKEFGINDFKLIGGQTPNQIGGGLNNASYLIEFTNRAKQLVSEKDIPEFVAKGHEASTEYIASAVTSQKSAVALAQNTQIKPPAPAILNYYNRASALNISQAARGFVIGINDNGFLVKYQINSPNNLKAALAPDGHQVITILDNRGNEISNLHQIPNYEVKFLPENQKPSRISEIAAAIQTLINSFRPKPAPVQTALSQTPDSDLLEGDRQSVARPGSFQVIAGSIILPNNQSVQVETITYPNGSINLEINGRTVASITKDTISLLPSIDALPPELKQYSQTVDVNISNIADQYKSQLAQAAQPAQPPAPPPPAPAAPINQQQTILQNVSNQESSEILKKTVIDGSVITIRTPSDPKSKREVKISTQTLKDNNLGPKYKTAVDGKTYYFSAPFIISEPSSADRFATIAYIEQDGKYIAHSYLTSNSQGIWRYYPDYALNYLGKIAHYGKGWEEESTSLTTELQIALSELAFKDVVNPQERELILAGLEKTEGKNEGSYYHSVDENPNKLNGNFYRPQNERHQRVPATSLDFTNSGENPQYPDFSKRLNIWQQRTYLYYPKEKEPGIITIETYLSKDGTLKYLFATSEKGEVWIASIELLKVNNQTNPTLPLGLRKSWVYSEDLTTPAFDYLLSAQISFMPEGSSDYNAETQRIRDLSVKLPGEAHSKYINLYPDYVSKIALIKAYLASKTQPSAPIVHIPTAEETLAQAQAAAAPAAPSPAKPPAPAVPTLLTILPPSINSAPAATEETQFVQGRLEILKDLLTKLTPDQQKFITEDTSGDVQALVSVILGIKPSLSIVVNPVLLTSIINNLPQDQSGLTGEFFYNRSQVQEIIKKYPQHFPDYTVGTNLDQYIAKLTASTTEDVPQEETIKTGLILGYPLNSVIAFTEAAKARTQLRNYYLSEQYKELSPNGQRAIENYFNKAIPPNESNQLVDQSERDIQTVLDQRFPTFSEKEKYGILARRGAIYKGYNFIFIPSSEADYDFFSKVEELYEKSGAQAYLNSQNIKDTEKSIPQKRANYKYNPPAPPAPPTIPHANDQTPPNEQGVKYQHTQEATNAIDRFVKKIPKTAKNSYYAFGTIRFHKKDGSTESYVLKDQILTHEQLFDYLKVLPTWLEEEGGKGEIFLKVEENVKEVSDYNSLKISLDSSADIPISITEKLSQQINSVSQRIEDLLSPKVLTSQADRIKDKYWGDESFADLFRYAGQYKSQDPNFKVEEFITYNLRQRKAHALDEAKNQETKAILEKDLDAYIEKAVQKTLIAWNKSQSPAKPNPINKFIEDKFTTPGKIDSAVSSAEQNILSTYGNRLLAVHQKLLAEIITQTEQGLAPKDSDIAQRVHQEFRSERESLLDLNALDALLASELAKVFPDNYKAFVKLAEQKLTPRIAKFQTDYERKSINEIQKQVKVVLKKQQLSENQFTIPPIEQLTGFTRQISQIFPQGRWAPQRFAIHGPTGQDYVAQSADVTTVADGVSLISLVPNPLSELDYTENNNSAHVAQAAAASAVREIQNILDNPSFRNVNEVITAIQSVLATTVQGEAVSAASRTYASKTGGIDKGSATMAGVAFWKNQAIVFGAGDVEVLAVNKSGQVYNLNTARTASGEIANRVFDFFGKRDEDPTIAIRTYDLTNDPLLSDLDSIVVTSDGWFKSFADQKNEAQVARARARMAQIALSAKDATSAESALYGAVSGKVRDDIGFSVIKIAPQITKIQPKVIRTIALGNSAGNTFILQNDPNILPRHAQITIVDDQTIIISNAGLNSTIYINGQLMQNPTRINPGSTIQFGNTLVKYDGLDQTATPIFSNPNNPNQKLTPQITFQRALQTFAQSSQRLGLLPQNYVYTLIKDLTEAAANSIKNAIKKPSPNPPLLNNPMRTDLTQDYLQNNTPLPTIDFASLKITTRLSPAQNPDDINETNNIVKKAVEIQRDQVKTARLFIGTTYGLATLKKYGAESPNDPFTYLTVDPYRAKEYAEERGNSRKISQKLGIDDTPVILEVVLTEEQRAKLEVDSHAADEGMYYDIITQYKLPGSLDLTQTLHIIHPIVPYRYNPPSQARQTQSLSSFFRPRLGLVPDPAQTQVVGDSVEQIRQALLNILGRRQEQLQTPTVIGQTSVTVLRDKLKKLTPYQRQQLNNKIQEAKDIISQSSPTTPETSDINLYSFISDEKQRYNLALSTTITRHEMIKANAILLLSYLDMLQNENGKLEDIPYIKEALPTFFEQFKALAQTLGIDINQKSHDNPSLTIFNEYQQTITPLPSSLFDLLFGEMQGISVLNRPEKGNWIFGSVFPITPQLQPSQTEITIDLKELQSKFHEDFHVLTGLTIGTTNYNNLLLINEAFPPIFELWYKLSTLQEKTIPNQETFDSINKAKTPSLKYIPENLNIWENEYWKQLVINQHIEEGTNTIFLSAAVMNLLHQNPDLTLTELFQVFITSKNRDDFFQRLHNLPSIKQGLTEFTQNMGSVNRESKLMYSGFDPRTLLPALRDISRRFRAFINIPQRIADAISNQAVIDTTSYLQSLGIDIKAEEIKKTKIILGTPLTNTIASLINFYKEEGESPREIISGILTITVSQFFTSGFVNVEKDVIYINVTNIPSLGFLLSSFFNPNLFPFAILLNSLNLSFFPNTVYHEQIHRIEGLSNYPLSLSEPIHNLLMDEVLKSNKNLVTAIINNDPLSILMRLVSDPNHRYSNNIEALVDVVAEKLGSREKALKLLFEGYTKSGDNPNLRESLNRLSNGNSDQIFAALKNNYHLEKTAEYYPTSYTTLKNELELLMGITPSEPSSPNITELFSGPPLDPRYLLPALRDLGQRISPFIPPQIKQTIQQIYNQTYDKFKTSFTNLTQNFSLPFFKKPAEKLPPVNPSDLMDPETAKQVIQPLTTNNLPQKLYETTQDIIQLTYEDSGFLSLDHPMVKELRGYLDQMKDPLSPPTRLLVSVKGTEKNAFSLADGTIIVTQELINSMSTIEEVVAILAHEQVHFEKNHAKIQFEDWYKQQSSNRFTLKEYLKSTGLSRIHEYQSDLSALAKLDSSNIDTLSLESALRKLGAVAEADFEHGSLLDRAINIVQAHMVIDFASSAIGQESKKIIPKEWKVDSESSLLEKLTDLKPSKQFQTLLKSAEPTVLKEFSKTLLYASGLYYYLPREVLVQRRHFQKLKTLMDLYNERLSQTNLSSEERRKAILLGLTKGLGLDFAEIEMYTTQQPLLKTPFDHFDKTTILNYVSRSDASLQGISLLIELHQKGDIYKALGLPIPKPDFPHELLSGNYSYPDFFTRSLKLKETGLGKNEESVKASMEKFQSIREEIARVYDKDIADKWFKTQVSKLIPVYMVSNRPFLSFFRKQKLLKITSELLIYLKSNYQITFNTENLKQIGINIYGYPYDDKAQVVILQSIKTLQSYLRKVDDDFRAAFDQKNGQQLVNILSSSPENFLIEIANLKSQTNLSKSDISFLLSVVKANLDKIPSSQETFRNDLKNGAIVLPQDLSEITNTSPQTWKAYQEIKYYLTAVYILTSGDELKERHAFINNFSKAGNIKSILDSLPLFLQDDIVQNLLSEGVDNNKEFINEQTGYANSTEKKYDLPKPRYNYMMSSGGSIQTREGTFDNADALTQNPIFAIISQKLQQKLKTSSPSLTTTIGVYQYYTSLLNVAYQPATNAEKFWGANLQMSEIISPFNLRLLEEFNTHPLSTLTPKDLIAYYRSVKKYIPQDRNAGPIITVLFQKIVDTLSLEDALAFMEEEAKSNSFDLGVVNRFIETRVRTKEDFDKAKQSISRTINSLTTEGNSEVGLMSIVNPLINFLSGEVDMTELLDGIMTQGKDDAKLRKILALPYWRASIENNPNWYNYRGYQVVIDQGKIKIIGPQAQNILMFSDLLNRLYSTTDVEKSLILRKILTSPGGILMNKAYHQETAKMITDRIESHPILTPLIRNILRATLNAGDPVRTFMSISSAVSPMMLKRPVQPGSNQDGAKKISDYLYGGKLGGLVGSIQDKWTEGRVKEFLDKDPEKERAATLQSQPITKTMYDSYQIFFTGLRTQLGMTDQETQAAPQEIKPTSPVEVILKVGQSLGPVGVRFLQVLGQYIDLPQEYQDQFSYVYDSMPGQSKYTAFALIERLAKTDPEVKNFLENELVSIDDKIGGGSIMTTFAITTKDQEGKLHKEVLKIKNPNSERFVLEIVKEIRNILADLKKSDPKNKDNYDIAERLLNTIEKWVLEDINDTNFSKEDPIFAKVNNNTQSKEGITIRVVPASLPNNIYIKREPFIEGPTLNKVLVTEQSQEVRRKLVSAVAESFVQQLTTPALYDSQKKPVYLVHSDIHKGNFIVSPNGQSIFTIDRNYYLKLNDADINFLRITLSEMDDKQKLFEMVRYFISQPENQQLGLDPNKVAEEIYSKLYRDEAFRVITGKGRTKGNLQKITKVLHETDKRGIQVPLRARILLKNLDAVNKMLEKEGLEGFSSFLQASPAPQ